MRISDRSSRGRVRKGGPLGADACSMMASNPSGGTGDPVEIANLISVVEVDAVVVFRSRRGFLEGDGKSIFGESFVFAR